MNQIKKINQIDQIDQINQINLIDNNLIKIVRPGIKEKKFRRALKRISKLAVKHNVYMGIDYEFNTKKIALMQIMFQIELLNTSTPIKRYYILYPPELDNKTIKYLKKYAMSNLNILKILHGSESLDLPYIIDDFYLNDNLSKKINFFRSLIDTRYLCEYLNYYYKIDNICRIYDLLVKYNIIDLETKTKLDENEKIMGPIYDIFIDINNLSSELITYAIHDVVYLIDVYKQLKVNIIRERPKDYFILVEVLRYSFMEKRLVSNIGDDIIIINMMNNYWININNSNQLKNNQLKNNQLTNNQSIKSKLNNIFELLLKDFIESFDYVKYIFNINYSKTNIQNILKLITYDIILSKYNVNSSNNEIVTYNLENNIKLLFDGLKMFELNYLINFLKKFQSYAKIKLI
jgi:hypothetical protein